MARNSQRETTFRFKQFSVVNQASAMKVGTDAVLLGSIASANNPASILDIGTGSGIIALMLAQRYPKANLLALEIDPEASAEASKNFAESPWGDRLTCECCDFTAWNSENRKFGLIVSNPPYFENSLQAPDPTRAVARHADSLSFSTIIRRANELLTADGILAMVGPANKLSDVIYEATLSRLYPKRIFNICTVTGKQPIRFVVELSCTNGPTSTQTLSVSTTEGKYSNEYANLTRDFYINL